MTYMDDIEAGGSPKFVKAVMENCRQKELDKLWVVKSSYIAHPLRAVPLY